MTEQEKQLLLEDLCELEYILDEARIMSLMDAKSVHKNFSVSERENLRLCSTIFKYLLKGVFHLRMLKEEGREINMLPNDFIERL